MSSIAALRVTSRPKYRGPYCAEISVRSARRGVDYRAIVRCEYFIDGTRSPGDTSAVGSGSHVRNWMAPSQKESAVKVHYNPLDVSDSMIDTGISGGTA
jgi:hypothetical protein